MLVLRILITTLSLARMYYQIVSLLSIVSTGDPVSVFLVSEPRSRSLTTTHVNLKVGEVDCRSHGHDFQRFSGPTIPY